MSSRASSTSGAARASGRFSSCRRSPPRTVLGVDGSRTILDRAKTRASNEPRITWQQLDLSGDLASLGRCDLVWAAMVIHHADDAAALLARISSLLERGGLLCVLERDDSTAYPSMLAEAGFELPNSDDSRAPAIPRLRSAGGCSSPDRRHRRSRVTYNRMVVGLLTSEALSDPEADRIFKALADATRRDILARAIEREQSVWRWRAATR